MLVVIVPGQGAKKIPLSKTKGVTEAYLESTVHKMTERDQ
jgi:hypothetical protein